MKPPPVPPRRIRSERSNPVGQSPREAESRLDSVSMRLDSHEGQKRKQQVIILSVILAIGLLLFVILLVAALLFATRGGGADSIASSNAQPSGKSKGDNVSDADGMKSDSSQGMPTDRTSEKHTAGHSGQTAEATEDAAAEGNRGQQDPLEYVADEDTNKNSVENPPESAGEDSSGSSSAVTGTGKYRTIAGSKFFGIEADGSTFVYVVDQSGSMAGGQFERAKVEVKRSVNSLSASQDFFVFFFADNEHPIDTPDALLPANGNNKLMLGQWLSTLQLEGGTEPEGALLRAIALKPDAIYFLTDGAFDPGVVQRVTMANGGVTKINTVTFGNKEGETMLKDIARLNGGYYLHVP